MALPAYTNRVGLVIMGITRNSGNTIARRLFDRRWLFVLPAPNRISFGSETKKGGITIVMPPLFFVRNPEKQVSRRAFSGTSRGCRVWDTAFMRESDAFCKHARHSFFGGCRQWSILFHLHLFPPAHRPGRESFALLKIKAPCRETTGREKKTRLVILPPCAARWIIPPASVSG